MKKTYTRNPITMHLLFCWNSPFIYFRHLQFFQPLFSLSFSRRCLFHAWSIRSLCSQQSKKNTFHSFSLLTFHRTWHAITYHFELNISLNYRNSIRKVFACTCACFAGKKIVTITTTTCVLPTYADWMCVFVCVFAISSLAIFQSKLK